MLFDARCAPSAQDLSPHPTWRNEQKKPIKQHGATRLVFESNDDATMMMMIGESDYGEPAEVSGDERAHRAIASTRQPLCVHTSRRATFRRRLFVRSFHRLFVSFG
jgi:hypothetical protein